jgi:hypothetical protein
LRRRFGDEQSRLLVRSDHQAVVTRRVLLGREVVNLRLVERQLSRRRDGDRRTKGDLGAASVCSPRRSTVVRRPRLTG